MGHRKAQQSQSRGFGGWRLKLLLFMPIHDGSRPTTTFSEANLSSNEVHPAGVREVA